MRLTFTHRLIITVAITVLFGAYLMWDYFDGGVVKHYLLHRDDLPGFSNWWGLLTIPTLSWYLLFRINRRVGNKMVTNTILYRLIAAIAFGITQSVLFNLGSDLGGPLMLALIFTSLFYPLYKAEYLLGFLLGMVFTFGPVLPVIIGTVLVLIFLVTYKAIRASVIYLIIRLKQIV